MASKEIRYGKIVILCANEAEADAILRDREAMEALRNRCHESLAEDWPASDASLYCVDCDPSGKPAKDIGGYFCARWAFGAYSPDETLEHCDPADAILASQKSSAP